MCTRLCSSVYLYNIMYVYFVHKPARRRCVRACVTYFGNRYYRVATPVRAAHTRVADTGRRYTHIVHTHTHTRYNNNIRARVQVNDIIIETRGYFYARIIIIIIIIYYYYRRRRRRRGHRRRNSPQCSFRTTRVSSLRACRVAGTARAVRVYYRLSAIDQNGNNKVS
jgi:hypothetical protein